jgi:hypothetical protein
MNGRDADIALSVGLRANLPEPQIFL